MTRDTSRFDQAAFQELFQTTIRDVATYWWPVRDRTARLCPFLEMRSDPEVDLEVNLERIRNAPSSNHAIFAQEGAIRTATKRFATLRQMAIEAAPIFSSPLMDWEIKVLDQSPSEDPEGPIPVTRIRISNIYITHYSQYQPKPASIEDAAESLAKVISALSVLDKPGDRHFLINDEIFPGNAPEEALFVYDVLTNEGFTDYPQNTPPVVREAFDDSAVFKRLRRRFRGVIPQEEA